MDPEKIRAFVQRDRQHLEALKANYWAERFRLDVRSTWDAAQALLDYARRVRPPFPSDAERSADFTAHVSLRTRLDRAAHAFASR